MGPFRMLVMAGFIAAAMIGSLYGLMRFETFSDRTLVTHAPNEDNPTILASASTATGLSAAESNVRHMPIEGGFRLGELTFERLTETGLHDDVRGSGDSPNALSIGPYGAEGPDSSSTELDETPAIIVAAQQTRQTRQTRPRQTRQTRPRQIRQPPAPRLHPNPGMHTLLVARGMMARNETVRGSCYRYLTEVFDRAGHHGWRNRRVVYRAERDGPYANLDLVRPGDWLYIVNDPSRTPVGTHSVLFVGWQDRARGYARVISHGGGGSVSAGRERGYDISQTYRIIRPILPQ